MHFPLRPALNWLLASAPIFSHCASLQKITSDFGPNPRNVGFFLFVPDKLAARPPILVNPHWCHGDAQASYAGSRYASLARRYGFIVIYPDSPNAADKCWDVSSNATLTHGGGGDSLGVVSMVRWTLEKYGGDPSRVFATGISSGAMMTSVLLGAYPDVFAAGSAFAGVPYGCFAGDGYGVWSEACAAGKVRKTGAEWAALVKAGYPGYARWRPRVQIFHGTGDEVLSYANFEEEIKEWAAVLGISDAPASATPDTPVRGWTKYVYGRNDWLEAYSAAGVSHNIQNQEATVMEWFDLACTGDKCFKWGQGGPKAR
ncbi:carbohydrate esterase family 1 protein [Daldinia caldariorum]|uniref:carbohydrate esterase family 1 protein n=1 Tax=Daldinia caldariorum TaxID=326644 RepID=UPI002007C373|nr:carbohydrate esterase family 1 protein [Daldinia caldariorum]KAI1467547.1 carbohydrate esterase family 1 protein [Daldinia caldariorum]